MSLDWDAPGVDHPRLTDLLHQGLAVRLCLVIVAASPRIVSAVRGRLQLTAIEGGTRAVVAIDGQEAADPTVDPVAKHAAIAAIGHVAGAPPCTLRRPLACTHPSCHENGFPAVEEEIVHPSATRGAASDRMSPSSLPGPLAPQRMTFTSNRKRRDRTRLSPQARSMAPRFHQSFARRSLHSGAGTLPCRRTNQTTTRRSSQLRRYQVSRKLCQEHQLRL